MLEANYRYMMTPILLTMPLICFNEQEYVGINKTQEPMLPVEPQTTMVLEEMKSRLMVSASYSYATLKPHEHRTFHGSLGGMQALYEYRPMNFFYGGGKFTWRQGKTEGDVGERSLVYFDVQERLGYTYAPEKKDWFLTLFSGLGYRHIGQKLTPKEGTSLRFRYNTFYLPVGFLTNYDITSYCSMGLDCIWMPQVYPTVTIAPLGGARWILSKTLSNLYVQMPITFRFTSSQRYHLVLTPFYEHWQDGHTTAKLSSGTPLGLPGNSYNFYGVELNFTFSF